MIDELAALFAGPAAADYLGEAVTIGEHMRQAGALAEAAGAAPALVAAALLHDVGHLTGGDDARHGVAGASWLSAWFGPSVTEPVRLHVAAKRYLCTASPGYFELLSPESVRTLATQGGPMTVAEAALFEKGRYFADAVAVRRWDEAAKDPAVTPPPSQAQEPRWRDEDREPRAAVHLPPPDRHPRLGMEPQAPARRGVGSDLPGRADHLPHPRPARPAGGLTAGCQAPSLTPGSIKRNRSVTTSVSSPITGAVPRYSATPSLVKNSSCARRQSAASA
jgi:predicted HD phosphohydrolase